MTNGKQVYCDGRFKPNYINNHSIINGLRTQLKDKDCQNGYKNKIQLCHLHEKHKYKDKSMFKIKGYKKMYHENINQIKLDWLN